MALPTIIKMTNHKLGLFEHAVNIFKWSTEFLYADNIIHYLIYLPDPFPRGLEVDKEGSSIFPMLKLSLHINRLGFCCYF